MSLAREPGRIARAGETARASVAELDWQQIAVQVETHFLHAIDAGRGVHWALDPACAC